MRLIGTRPDLELKTVRRVDPESDVEIGGLDYIEEGAAPKIVDSARSTRPPARQAGNHLTQHASDPNARTEARQSVILQ